MKRAVGRPSCGCRGRRRCWRAACDWSSRRRFYRRFPMPVGRRCRRFVRTIAAGACATGRAACTCPARQSVWECDRARAGPHRRRATGRRRRPTRPIVAGRIGRLAHQISHAASLLVFDHERDQGRFGETKSDGNWWRRLALGSGQIGFESGASPRVESTISSPSQTRLPSFDLPSRCGCWAGRAIGAVMRSRKAARLDRTAEVEPVWRQRQGIKRNDRGRRRDAPPGGRRHRLGRQVGGALQRFDLDGGDARPDQGNAVELHGAARRE